MDEPKMDAPVNDSESPAVELDPMNLSNQPDFTHIFGNDLIFLGISQYLGIPDLKILRQTCRLVLAKVNLNRKFTSNLRLTVSDESINETGMGGELVEWKNVRIVVSRTSSHNFPSIKTGCIEDLQLIRPASYTYEYSHCQQSESACFELLEKRQIPNIKSLTLDLDLLSYEIPVSALVGLVGTVRELRLWKVNGFYPEIFHDTENVLIAKANLEMIAALPWKLHTFYVPLVRYIPQLLSNAMAEIPASSASSLEALTICCLFLGSSKLHGVRFPRLRSLCLGLEGCTQSEIDGVSLAEFLRLQPQLEELDVNSDRLYGNGNLDPSVLNAIRSTCSSKLYKLRLRGTRWLKSFPDADCWAFIRDLRGLEDFLICGSYGAGRSEENVISQILNSLPVKTKSLEVHDVICGLGAPQPATIAALTGFPNLIHLTISKCYELINDGILQTICRNVTKLRVFRFGSDRLTDFGITGERGNYNSGASLRNLKGLRDLDIFNCGKITEGGILEAIQFKELRNLVLNTVISDDTLLQIGSRNPSLEYVFRYVGIWEERQPLDEYHRPLFASMLTVNPRLTRIQTEDVGFRRLAVMGMRRDLTCRPSYGVSTTLSNATTLSHIRNTMKVAKFSKEDQCPGDIYYYSMTN